MNNTGGYFDYNATTPLSEGVKSAMIEAMEQFENPSAIYAAPDGPKALLTRAREEVAALIGAEPEQIFFTSGATESNNWILRSILEDASTKGAFVTSAIEHDATLASGRAICKQQNRDMRLVAPNAECIIEATSVREACQNNVSLLSVMLANNETGAVQPIVQIAEVARQIGSFFHVDAVQAAGKIPINVGELDCDSLSLSAHKFYGPKGVGVLYVRDPKKLVPMIVGGGQEGGLRAGTENIIGIAGMGAAAAEARTLLTLRSAHASALRETLIVDLVNRKLPIQINGPTHLDNVIHSTLNLSFLGTRAEALVMRLGLCDGIKVSLGSACSTNKDSRHSHVLQAMGLDEERLVGAIRISFGCFTSQEDVARLAASLDANFNMIQSLAAAE